MTTRTAVILMSAWLVSCAGAGDPHLGCQKGATCSPCLDDRCGDVSLGTDASSPVSSPADLVGDATYLPDPHPGPSRACLDQALRCGAEGLESCVAGNWVLSKSCPCGCIVGDEGPAECRQTACKPAESRCVDDLRQRCRSDRCGWLATETCHNGCSGDACRLCAPGSRRCSEDGSIERCDDGTGTWTADAQCEFGCEQSGDLPACRLCKPLSGRCVQGVQQQCDLAGSGWTVQPGICPLGCTAETSLCLVCQPKALRCNDGTIERCNDLGTAWESQQSCPGGCAGETCVSPPTTRQLTAGTHHSCLIAPNDSSLWCWGSNDAGQLGLPLATKEVEQALRVDAHAWRDITAGIAHTCGIRNDGTLWCWGSNDSGQLARGDGSGVWPPARVGTHKWLLVRAGNYHTCALRSDHTIWCWGQFVDSATTFARSELMVEPQRVGAEGVTWLTLDSGATTSCGIVRSSGDDAGAIRCWGWNHDGQFGVGTRSDAFTLAASDGPAGEWRHVSVGARHVCALSVLGSLHCWGSNSNGRLGIGTTQPSYAPQQVGADQWLAVDVGVDRTCGVTVDGRAWCWGANDLTDKLGVDFTIDRHVPTLVDTLFPERRWRTISSGARHSCGQREDSSFWCWGAEQLGRRLKSSVGAPLRVLGGHKWQRFAHSASRTCAIDAQQELYCWGQSFTGNAVGVYQSRPLPTLLAAGKWRAIAVEGSHACALAEDFSLWCWGDNTWGQLGTGDLLAAAGPTRVDVPWSWSAIALSATRSCAVRKEVGQLYCWGRGQWIETPSPHYHKQTTPELQHANWSWNQVVIDESYGCGIDTSAKLWCWGAMLYWENTKKYSRFDEPFSVDAGPWVTLRPRCAIKQDGSLWCGGPLAGQLPAYQPLALIDGGPWSDVTLQRPDLNYLWALAAGTQQVSVISYYFSVVGAAIATKSIANSGPWSALHSTCMGDPDGTLWCHGSNVYGALGIGVDPSVKTILLVLE